jgi:hypothetical protein
VGHAQLRFEPALQEEERLARAGDARGSDPALDDREPNAHRRAESQNSEPDDVDGASGAVNAGMDASAKQRGATRR